MNSDNLQRVCLEIIAHHGTVTASAKAIGVDRAMLSCWANGTRKNEITPRLAIKVLDEYERLTGKRLPMDFIYR